MADQISPAFYAAHSGQKVHLRANQRREANSEEGFGMICCGAMSMPADIHDQTQISQTESECAGLRQRQMDTLRIILVDWLVLGRRFAMLGILLVKKIGVFGINPLPEDCVAYLVIWGQDFWVSSNDQSAKQPILLSSGIFWEPRTSEPFQSGEWLVILEFELDSGRERRTGLLRDTWHFLGVFHASWSDQ